MAGRSDFSLKVLEINRAIGAGEKSPKKARALRKGLLRFLETAEVTDEIQSFAKESHKKLLVEELKRELELNKFRIPSVVYVIRCLKMPKPQALKQFRVKKSDLETLEQLAQQLDIGIGEFVIDLPKSVPWIANLLSQNEQR